MQEMQEQNVDASEIVGHLCEILKIYGLHKVEL